MLEVVPVVGGAVQQRSFDPPPLFNKAASGSPRAARSVAKKVSFCWVGAPALPQAVDQAVDPGEATRAVERVDEVDLAPGTTRPDMNDRCTDTRTAWM